MLFFCAPVLALARQNIQWHKPGECERSGDATTAQNLVTINN
tara:strand:- start:3757 stop:3882 length:126 start_codon:yes stop_codon:yes gene_type:complete